jgi:hypothetical protein
MMPWTPRIYQASPAPLFLPLRVRVLGARWKQRALFLQGQAIGLTDPDIRSAVSTGQWSPAPILPPVRSGYSSAFSWPLVPI